MNIKIHSAELNRMLKIVSQCTDERFPQFSNIEVTHADNMLTVRGTNGTFHASMSAPLMGGDGESFCVDGSMFAKVCAMCGGEISISTDGKICTIKGAGRTRIPLIPADVQKQERVSGPKSVMEAEDFIRCYGGVAYAVASDQSRIQLTGVHCEFGAYGVKMVALDGFQMSVETAVCTGEIMKTTVPGNFMKLVASALLPGEKVTFRTNKNRIEASTECMVLSCGLLAGEYPDYNRILPKEFGTECLVNTEALKNALKGGNVIASKQNLVKLEVGTDSLRVMSNSEEKSADYEADISCQTQGEGLKIAFNQKYLMNTLNAIDAEETVLQFNTSVTPCIAHGKDEVGVRLLLPVRTQG